jgi:type I restriction enzyme S subunit
VSQIPVGQKAALGRNMTGVRCRTDFPFPTVLIEMLLSRAMRDEIALKLDTGTILDALNVRNIPRLRFVRGTRAVLTLFERTCRPLRALLTRRITSGHPLMAVRSCADVEEA